MPNQTISSYRSFGTTGIVAPVIINEGTPEVNTLTLSEQVPNGLYEVQHVVLWTANQNIYFNFRADIDGATGITISKTHTEPNASVDFFSIPLLIPVSNELLSVEYYAEFPTQGGNANGSIERFDVWWERRRES